MIPLMGLGTFIGIENDHIESQEERMSTTEYAVFNALRIGYRHLDLAEAYGNNLAAIGNALQRAFKPISEEGLGLKRDDVWLTMKSNTLPLEKIQLLINTLRCDYFDSYLLHHPYMSVFLTESQLSQTWQAMNNFPKSIIRNIGVSNCYKPHLQRLLSVCQKYGLSPPMFNEVESNLLYPNDETIHFCQENHIQVIAYSPLGYNMAKFLTNPTLQQSNPVLIEAASTLNASLAQTALAWHMAKGVAVIPKSTNIHRLKENFEATQFISSITSDLTDQLKTLEAGPAFGDAVTDVAQNAYDCAQRLTWSVEQTSALDIIESSPLFASTQRTINASQIIEKTKDDKTP